MKIKWRRALSIGILATVLLGSFDIPTANKVYAATGGLDTILGEGELYDHVDAMLYLDGKWIMIF
mgnify:CR=1 FL=1